MTQLSMLKRNQAKINLLKKLLLQLLQIKLLKIILINKNQLLSKVQLIQFLNKILNSLINNKYNYNNNNNSYNNNNNNNSLKRLLLKIITTTTIIILDNLIYNKITFINRHSWLKIIIITIMDQLKIS